jgi:hypothetical protein
MMIVVVLVSVAIFVTAASVIAWPVVRGDQLPDVGPSGPAEELTRVDDDLQRTLASIKEIEFDHASGHLSDEDFSTLNADERAKAIELLRVRDAMEHPPADPRGSDT